VPIDIEKVVGAELEPTTYSWTEKDLILYNLGVGAGDPPTDPNELEYVYEGALKAVPSFGTIPPFAMMMSMGSVSGVEIELAQVLHGDQKLTVHAPIPPSGTVSQTGRITNVYDKGKGALMVLELMSVLEKTGERLFTNRSGVFLRGEGGFGGDAGPPASNRPPDREPDRVVESNTLPQQALLYRMVSGDGNPLHADPTFAALAGFDRPILHGLCTYGVVLKSAIDELFGGRANDFATYEARFSGHVFPGETLVSSFWEDDEGWVVSAGVKEREKTVLSNARVTVRD
jgi:acyl dehydratase